MKILIKIILFIFITINFQSSAYGTDKYSVCNDLKEFIGSVYAARARNVPLKDVMRIVNTKKHNDVLYDTLKSITYEVYKVLYSDINPELIEYYKEYFNVECLKIFDKMED